ncbi:MAG: MxaD family protein [Acidiphilium sp. 37-64-53]|uniref:SRPBCC family protein n=1 Tax=Acidiphilium TaxID=522 RepID=UPI000BD9B0BB|nr:MULTISPECIES: SRPBCC family protein [Acidiphilium]OYW00738.1 MAG: MxaD family protein [Acidiphilium sp. 37-64-53]OZB28137.1 MAG: MxaD family protein [Acidiphilium sp. 34-64-41]HQT85842.1 SRPBCC family protein [Acidiphilium rubrum]
MDHKISRRTAIGALPIAAIGLAIAGTGTAQAAPVLHVTKTVVIAAPAAKVWSIIDQFGTLTWVPAVKSSSATMGNQPGSVRTLNLGGPIVTEQLKHYSAARMRYSYIIQPTASNMKVLPVSHYYSTISVTKLGADKTRVTWTGSFKRADLSAHPKPGMDNKAAITAITGVYTTGLANLTPLAAQ